MRVISIILGLVIATFGFAGGGGSDSGGGGSSSSSSSSSYSSSSSSSSSHSGDGSSDPVATGVALVVFVGLMVYSFVSSRKKRNRPTGVGGSDIHETPRQKQLREEATQIFEKYQDDWSNFNLDGIAAYTTPEYYQHASLMLELLKDLHRTNKVSQLSVNGTYLMTTIDDDTPLPVSFRVKYYFSGLDEVIDTDTGEKLYSEFAKEVHETWSFVYDGKALRLDGIAQPTESASHLVRNLADFAAENHLFYSPDWGRYALPSRGLIFGEAQMAVADINNHIIGKWNDLLIQMYTYAENPNELQLYYLVGQITLPKRYQGVIVHSKKSKSRIFGRIDKSYEKFEMEWNDFNDRYEVYAASADALPAFELLNPKFMEYLYSKNPEYNLEVVDNSIYIFMNNSEATEQDYAVLLEILSAAYKELER